MPTIRDLAEKLIAMNLEDDVHVTILINGIELTSFDVHRPPIIRTANATGMRYRGSDIPRYTVTRTFDNGRPPMVLYSTGSEPRMPIGTVINRVDKGNANGLMKQLTSMSVGDTTKYDVRNHHYEITRVQ